MFQHTNTGYIWKQSTAVEFIEEHKNGLATGDQREWFVKGFLCVPVSVCLYLFGGRERV